MFEWIYLRDFHYFFVISLCKRNLYPKYNLSNLNLKIVPGSLNFSLKFRSCVLKVFKISQIPFPSNHRLSSFPQLKKHCG